MSGYLDSRKLTNVKGRINYVTDKKRQENIVDYYNTTDDVFWKMLAKENQERHREVKAGGKCCEARELIIGIPQNSSITAEEICKDFKKKYNVECTCAIHQNNKKGIINRHCHLIFSEREKLKEPQITEERKATRTYYYDSKGNKCKKEDAVKVVKKGTVLQKRTIRYFSDKNDYFKSQKFIYDCKQFFLKEKLGIDWSFEMDQQNKELAEKHIGKNNPKEEYIRQNNNLKGTIKDVCKAGDYMFECEKGETLKRFKEDYNITSFVTSKYEENKGKVNTFVKEMQSIYKDRVKNEVRKHNDINEDINFLQETDYIFRPVQENIISTYENETQTREKPRVIDFLKNKIYHLLERIENLIHLQDFLHIERKNQIEIEEIKRTHNLIIKDNDYYKKQERQKDDIDLEL